jgi:hypothetical protein
VFRKVLATAALVLTMGMSVAAADAATPLQVCRAEAWTIKTAWRNAALQLKAQYPDKGRDYAQAERAMQLNAGTALTFPNYALAPVDGNPVPQTEDRCDWAAANGIAYLLDGVMLNGESGSDQAAIIDFVQSQKASSLKQEDTYEACVAHDPNDSCEG